jgi:uncharacterized protein
MSFRVVARLFAFAGLAASLSAQSSVWEVQRGTTKLFLGGTCHVLRECDLPLPREFDVAFAASTAIYFETDVARIQSLETQRAIIAEGMFTDGRTLASVLSPKAWKLAQAYCAKSGFPIETVQLMKPSLFALTIATLEIHKLGVSTEGVDLRYFKQATEARKKTGELESVEDHLGFLMHLGAGHENDMVLNAIEEADELPAMINASLGAWKIGDMAKLDELMLRDMRTKHPAIYRELIVKRNHAWLPKIEELVQSPEVELVLVGVGHMAGKDGLLALLRAKGYAVTQLNAAAAQPTRKK